MAIADLFHYERSKNNSRRYKWIPESWIADESNNDRMSIDPGKGVYRDPARYSERYDDLDDTRPVMRRRYEDSHPPPHKIQVPFPVIVTLCIYLVTQLIAGVWWAATMQAQQNHEIADRAREERELWETIQTYKAEVNQLRLEIARYHPNNRRLNTEGD